MLFSAMYIDCVNIAGRASLNMPIVKQGWGIRGNKLFSGFMRRYLENGIKTVDTSKVTLYN